MQTSKRGRMLWVSPISPLPIRGGSHLRNHQLMRAASRAYDVTLVCPTPGDDRAVEELREVCETVLTISSETELSGRTGRIWSRLRDRAHPQCIVPRELPRMRDAVRRLAAARPFDIAFGSLAVAPALAESRATTVILDEQNFEAALYRQFASNESVGLRWLARLDDSRLVGAYERRWLPTADLVTACSHADADALRGAIRALPPVEVVPNGVAVGEAKPCVGSRDANQIVMVGGMAYAPNADGAVFLVRDVMPLVWRTNPEMNVLIVGSDPPPNVTELADSRVTVTGTVPDVAPFLRRACLEVVPLRSGGGTRLKILEAMASCVPVVSTRIGASGFDFRDREEIWLADSAAELASGILALSASADRAAALARAALARVEREFSWDVIGDRFRSVLAAAAAGGASS